METTKRDIKLKIAGAIIAIIAFSGCDNFLDDVPDNRVALDDLEKAAQLLTGAYSPASPAFTDWMTDNTGFIRGASLRPHHTQAYAWEDFFDDPGQPDHPTFFWQGTYGAIAQANEVLAVLDELPAITDEDKELKRAVESEALLTRAYGHFMLVNIFARHYDDRTSDTDLGIPYVDTPETVFIQQYTRNTVQEVYDRVEEDMLRGIELVNDNFFANTGKFHFNRNAAIAFASRFYLFKGDYESCIEWSDVLLGQNPAAFVRDFTSEEYRLAKSSITGYPQLYTSTDEPANLLLIRKAPGSSFPDWATVQRPIFTTIFSMKMSSLVLLMNGKIRHSKRERMAVFRQDRRIYLKEAALIPASVFLTTSGLLFGERKYCSTVLKRLLKRVGWTMPWMIFRSLLIAGIAEEMLH